MRLPGSQRRRRLRRAAWSLLALAALFVALDRALRLPDPLFSTPYSAVLLGRDGSVLGAHVAADGQWRFPPSARVPDKLRRALILAEDQRFSTHLGVDPLALLRALRSNLRAGRVVSGGSTLSMQVVRMARGNPARTYAEKAREIWLALALERAHDKDAILALYAAHAPFGGNVVGLEAAAWRYFGRPADTLSWAEAALLAVLPRAPGQLHPARDPERLRERRNALLARLHARGELDALDLALAQREPLPTRAEALPEAAPHLLATLIAGRDGASGWLGTTLDPALQGLATRRAREHAARLVERGIHNLAVLVLDTTTLEVLAYVGNAPDPLDGLQGRAVDIVQRPRSTGSVLKPVLYAAMLQEGSLLPDMLVPDVPTQIAGYRPENYDRRFRGAVPARDALARSLNVPAVRLLQRFGVARFHGLLQELGMRTLWRPADDYGLTLILGGAEGTLWDLAALYASLGQRAQQRGRGDHPDGARPFVLRVPGAPSPAGGESTTPPPAGQRIGPGAAWLTLDALRAVERPPSETGWQQLGGTPVAWKTGTSFGLRDAWAIGVTPRVTVAVWAGNASGEGVPGLVGVEAAAPLLFAVLDAAPSAAWFPRPEWDLRAVDVCADDGYLATPLCRARRAWIPRDSRPVRTSPHHRRVFTDPSGAWQVHAGCESLARMRAQTWLVLPPVQERYYRAGHPDHRSPPPLRPDCAQHLATHASAEFELVYPEAGSRIHIPRELAGARSRAVLVAEHRRPEATLYWHLDDTYLGQTREIHRWPLLAAPGRHRLTLVDDRGQVLERALEVLDAGDPRDEAASRALDAESGRYGSRSRESSDGL